jgi:hypothetical protein
MSDILVSPHLDMQNMKAKGRSLHRRTQSNTAFDMNALLNRRPDPHEFENLSHTHHIINSDSTQKAIEASKNHSCEKEVIVDDIDEIPNSGYIIPKSYTTNSSNPLSFIKRRNLSVCTALLTNTCPIKKIDLLTDARKINDLTGLNTIYEKGVEDLETEAAENRSSRNNSQHHSRKSSQTLSKNSSQGHMRQGGLHSKHSSTEFKPVTKDNNTSRSSSIEKTPHKQTSKNGIAIPNINTDSEFMEKRNKFIQELQRASLDRKKENSSPLNLEAPIYHARAISNFANNNLHREVALPQNVNKEKAQHFLNILDRSKLKTNIVQPKQGQPQKPQLTIRSDKSEHERRESMPNPSRWGETLNRSLTPSSLFSNTKSYRELSNVPSNHPIFKDHFEKASLQNNLENKVGTLDETVRSLTNKTNLLEDQVKSLSSLIELLNTENVHLEMVIVYFYFNISESQGSRHSNPISTKCYLQI